MTPFSIRPPDNWQDFERCMRVLLQCELDDPSVQLNGTSGQRQNGVDASGTRKSDHKAVGLQCKCKFRTKVKKTELRKEVDLALNFTPALDEFILATTAAKDEAIEAVARTITQEEGAKGRRIKVSVWGWGDIEDRARKHVPAMEALDPTFSPYVKQMYAQLKAQFAALSVPSHNPRDAQLYAEFEAIFTSTCVGWLKSFDFGNPVRKELLDPIEEYSATWTGVAKEFVDCPLEAKAQEVKAAACKFTALTMHLNWINSGQIMKTVKDDAEQRGAPRSQATLDRATALNSAATTLAAAVEDFQRLARKSLSA